MERWIVLALGVFLTALAVWLLRRFDTRVHDERPGALQRPAMPLLGSLAGVLLLLVGILDILFAVFVFR